MPQTILRTHPPATAEVALRIGLIADTHAPARMRELPPAALDLLAGVDLILHAGDIGELWVLDRLGAVAPTLAVHGNDEADEAQRELPYQQLVGAAGRRILLTHAHYPERADELAARGDNAWAPKLARRAAMARRAGAPIMVFGHTHIPMTLLWDDVLLVNPGALASGNYLSRQLLRSVAHMLIDHAGSVWVDFFDVDRPGQCFTPAWDWEAGFEAALQRISASIADTSAWALWPRLRALFEPGVLDEASENQIRAVLYKLAEPRWNGDPSLLSADDFLVALRQHLDATLWARVARELGA